jgi:hypothetical protein
MGELPALQECYTLLEERNREESLKHSLERRVKELEPHEAEVGRLR